VGLGATFLILPILTFMSIWVFASSYVGGEVREVKRNQLLSSLGALAFLGVSLIANYLLVKKLTGYDFLTAVNIDYFNGKLSELPIAPYFNLFATLATNNPVLQILTGVGYMFLSILFVPVIIMFCTRMVFAWAMDRVMPAPPGGGERALPLPHQRRHLHAGDLDLLPVGARLHHLVRDTGRHRRHAAGGHADLHRRRHPALAQA
jgi:hypothetical protein